MRKLFWVCAALIGVSAVTSAVLWQHLQSARALTAKLRVQPAPVALPSPPVVEPRSAPQPPQVVATAPAVAAVPGTQVVTPAQTTAAMVVSRRMSEQQELLSKDPEYRRARLVQIRASVRRNHPGVEEELGLSPGEAGGFFDFLAQLEMTMSESLPQGAASIKDMPQMQQVLREYQERQQQRNDAIAIHLGPARYAQWQQYLKTVPARDRAMSISKLLSQAGQPLNGQQLKSVTAALISQGDRAGSDSPGIPALVAPHMNAQQLAIVRAEIQQQDALSRSYTRARDRVIANSQEQGKAQ